MASFAPWAAALAGFRLVRERPLVALAWAGVIFVGRLASLILTTAISGPHIPALDAAVNARTIDPQALAIAYRAVAPGYVVGAVIVMPFIAMVAAAVYRAYLRPDEGGWCFLRAGRREAAMLILIVSLNLIVMVALFLTVALIAAAANLVPDDAAASLIEIVGLAGAACAIIWLLTRLVLAGPLTFQAGRLILLRSWPLTRGQVWPLLGAFIIAEGLVLLVAAMMLTMCIGVSGVVLTAMGGSVDHMSDALKPAQTVAQVFRPLPLIFSVFEAAILTQWGATLQGVIVCAYRSFAPAESPTPVLR